MRPSMTSPAAMWSTCSAFCVAIIFGCGGPSQVAGTGGAPGAGGAASGGTETSGSGGAVGGGVAESGGAAGSGGAVGSGGRAWQAENCEPADFPAGVWTPEPWQAYADYPDCVHEAVEAKCAEGFCEIPAGCFVTGAPTGEYGASPSAIQATILLTHDFAIQQAEFGWSEWLDLGFEEPDELTGEVTCRAAGCPVSRVTWFSALAAANALSESQGLPSCYELSGCQSTPGKRDHTCASVTLTTATVHDCAGYRLPTQVEWEYAYRAGTQTTFYSGSAQDNGPSGSTDCYEDPNLSKIGWYCQNALDVQPSKCRAPNRWGLYDMAGNLPEWSSSSSRVQAGPATDPQDELEGAPPEEVRTLGGSIYLWATACGASFGLSIAPEDWSGFRLARTLNP